MRVIDPLLGIREMMRITGWSRVTIYRKVAAARAGQSRFPVPVSDNKERLRWCATDVEAYCQARAAPQLPVSVVSPSPAKQTKAQREQQEATLQALARHNIYLNKGATNE